MNLLVTGAWSSAKEYIKTIEQMGYAVCFMQHEKEKLPCSYEWIEGIIGNGIFMFHPIKKFVNLKYIQLTSAGYDRVPMNYVKKHNITIHNAKGVYSIPMAEFAIASVLQLYKKLQIFAENQKKHCWEKHRGLLELNGKTVCIVGCGDVGKECAKRFAAFGCNVIGVNRTVREIECFQKIYELKSIEEGLVHADIIILTIAETDQTRKLINKERLQKIKSTAIIINIARGAIVDMNALLEHLDEIGGAVLDVFEEEPLKENSPLWEKENVIITPHNSFVGEMNNHRLGKLILKNLGEKRNESAFNSNSTESYMSIS